MTDVQDSKSRVKRPFPSFALQETLVVAQAIQDKNAGKPMKRLLLADAIGRKPMSTDFRDLLSSSYKYGLTEGTEKADYIALTPLGVEATRPKSAAQETQSKQKAVLNVELFNKIYTHFKDAKFPSGKFFENTLEQEFAVPRQYVSELMSQLSENGSFSGLIRTISGSQMVMFDDLSPVSVVGNGETDHNNASEHVAVDIADDQSLPQEEAPVSSAPKPIFIAHGKNKKPLDQLTKILDQFGIKYVVAVNEANSGRPIPQKVKDLMGLCGSAIFIFSKDGEEINDAGETIPNLNVVFELGAASVSYGEKVIIFKEDGLKFTSDFDSLGHIRFESDKLEAQAMFLMKELISMGFLKLVAAS